MVATTKTSSVASASSVAPTTTPSSWYSVEQVTRTRRRSSRASHSGTGAAGSQKVDAAEKFISWATSKHYLELVASKEGWANVPPGTRTSLYNNPDYQKAAPFAKMTLDSINSADPTKPTVKPVPYVGVQFVAIPEFEGLGTTVGQQFSAALTGATSVADALANAQASTEREMKRAGYPK